MVQLTAGAGSQEGYTSIVERLQNQMGEVAVYEQSVKLLDMDNETTLDPEFDRAGLHALMGRSPPQN